MFTATTTVPQPPRLDVKLLLIVAMLIASGITFFAVCAEARADIPPLRTGGVVPVNESSSLGSPGHRWHQLHVDEIVTRAISFLDSNGEIRFGFDDNPDAATIDRQGLRVAGRLEVNGDDVATLSHVMTAVAVSTVVGSLLGFWFAVILFHSLWSRAFVMRRWVARAHSSMLRRLAQDPAATPSR